MGAPLVLEERIIMLLTQGTICSFQWIQRQLYGIFLTENYPTYIPRRVILRSIAPLRKAYVVCTSIRSHLAGNDPRL